MTGPATRTLESHLARFPRHALALTPTPIEAALRLSQTLGGVDLAIKRDDLTGFGGGGNKARQLEYSLGEAVAKGADMLLVTGAVQSNYMRIAAAAAARLGMACHLQFENRVADMGADYHENGNVLLDRLFGATISHFPVGEDEAAADASLTALAEEYRAGKRAGGRKPYLLTLSADTKPLGALGYMRGAAEILDQLAATGERIDALITPSGSAVTHVGLLVGLRLLGSDMPVHGICVRRDAEAQKARVAKMVRLTEALIGCGTLVDPVLDIHCHDDWLGPGYGQIVETTREAIDLAGRLEGIIVDPVYTAKGLAGAIGLARRRIYDEGSRLLYLHTGGLPSIFAYRDALSGDHQTSPHG